MIDTDTEANDRNLPFFFFHFSILLLLSYFEKALSESYLRIAKRKYPEMSIKMPKEKNEKKKTKKCPEHCRFITQAYL